METIYEKLEGLATNSKPISVKFIRLGEGSRNGPYCIKESKIAFGFSTDKNISFWNSLKNGKVTSEEIKRELLDRNENVSVAFRQAKEFFLDDGNTLWVTRLNRTLYFGFSDGGNAELSPIGETQKSMKFGWLNEDKKQNKLLISELNGGITKTLNYQSTICDFSPAYAKLLVNRILCIPNADRLATEEAYNSLIHKLEKLIKTFEPKDFELLIELIISRMGLKRIGVAGKQEETTDLELSNPVTYERWVVQVKSKTDQNELKEYIRKLREYQKIIDSKQNCKMIYAYHTGEVQNSEPDVVTWDVKKISKLAVDNGLVDWILSVAPV